MENERAKEVAFVFSLNAGGFCDPLSLEEAGIWFVDAESILVSPRHRERSTPWERDRELMWGV